MVRQEVELHECPSCKGVWLSRESLRTIINRSEDEVQAATQLYQPGSSSLKHARRDEDWIDYYPEGAVEEPQSSLSELFKA